MSQSVVKSRRCERSQRLSLPRCHGCRRVCSRCQSGGTRGTMDALALFCCPYTIKKEAPTNRRGLSFILFIA